MYHLFLWLSLSTLIIAFLLAIFGLEFTGYLLLLPIFLLLYSILTSLISKASNYPKKVLARISATLYVLGFFWFVLSLSVLVLSLVFYSSAASRGMLRLLHSIILIGLTVLGLSVLSIIAARKLDELPRL